MFDKIKEVPSLELCKKLKELGYPQDGGGFYWVVFDDKVELKYVAPMESTPLAEKYFNSWKRLQALFKAKEVIKAPTVRELGEWLPIRVQVSGKIYVYQQSLKRNRSCHREHPYWVGYVPLHGEEGKTEAEARAKLLIWLKENNYIEFRKRGE